MGKVSGDNLEKLHDWVKNSDPSWFPRVLRVLQRDYPHTAAKVWGDAISENAEEQVKMDKGDGTEAEIIDSPNDGTEVETL